MSCCRPGVLDSGGRRRAASRARSFASGSSGRASDSSCATRADPHPRRRTRLRQRDIEIVRQVDLASRALLEVAVASAWAVGPGLREGCSRRPHDRGPRGRDRHRARRGRRWAGRVLLIATPGESNESVARKPHKRPVSLSLLRRRGRRWKSVIGTVEKHGGAPSWRWQRGGARSPCPPSHGLAAALDPPPALADIRGARHRGVRAGVERWKTTLRFTPSRSRSAPVGVRSSTRSTRSTSPMHDPLGVETDKLLVSQLDTGEQALGDPRRWCASGAIDHRHRLRRGSRAEGGDRREIGRFAHRPRPV